MHVSVQKLIIRLFSTFEAKQVEYSRLTFTIEITFVKKKGKMGCDDKELAGRRRAASCGWGCGCCQALSPDGGGGAGRLLLQLLSTTDRGSSTITQDAAGSVEALLFL